MTPDYPALIASECDRLKALLLAKNREYGASAFEPIRIMSDLTAVERIEARIDEKLKRLQTIRQLGAVTIAEDTESDLAGCFVLLKVARGLERSP